MMNEKEEGTNGAEWGKLLHWPYEPVKKPEQANVVPAAIIINM